MNAKAAAPSLLDAELSTPADTEFVLVDLSSIAYPIWHTTQSDPDPNKASQQIVARVRALAGDHTCVGICCDSGRSFRKELNATYKANRPPAEAPLHHQIDLAKEQLAQDGFPVWSFSGFEADDVIASAVAKVLAGPACLTALVVSADKDLLQLVGPRVRVKNARDGAIFDTEGVGAKFGVRPEQMRDFLTLVGDTADNIAGAQGIGPKKAAELLAKFGTLDELYTQLLGVGGAALGIQPAVSRSLQAFKNAGTLESTRALITLRTDVDVPVDAMTKPRVPAAVASFDSFGVDDEPDADLEPAEHEADVQHPMPAAVPSATTPVTPSSAPALSTAMAVRQPQEILPPPAEWERQLDPRSMREARVLARDMFDSRMFADYGTPQGVLATVMVGRELGLPAMASLRSIYNIEGKHSLSAALMVALVLKSGLAEYFEPISFSDKEATFETKRKGARNPVRLTHTFEMGKQAWPKTKADWERSFLASGWGRNPTDMVVARAQARLARMIYPDLLAGLYTPEELDEIRLREAA